MESIQSTAGRPGLPTPRSKDQCGQWPVSTDSRHNLSLTEQHTAWVSSNRYTTTTQIKKLKIKKQASCSRRNRQIQFYPHTPARRAPPTQPYFPGLLLALTCSSRLGENSTHWPQSNKLVRVQTRVEGRGQHIATVKADMTQLQLRSQ